MMFQGDLAPGDSFATFGPGRHEFTERQQIHNIYSL